MVSLTPEDKINTATINPVVDFFNNLRDKNLNEGLTLEKDTFKLIEEVLEYDEYDINFGYKNGPERTQHGVNAEHICIAETNAKEIRDAFKEGRDPILMEKSPAVNGPDDMIRGDEIYQAKYYQTAKGSLEGCIEHLEKYGDRYAGNDKAFYVIPDEQYEILLSIKEGNIPEGYSEITAETVRKKIEHFEKVKGESIEKTMQGGGVSYDKAHQEHNAETNAERRERLEEKHREEEARLKEEYSPNMVECFKTCLVSAGISGGLTAAFEIYSQAKNGKNIFRGGFEEEDYKNLGKNTLKAAGSASVTTGVLYWLKVAMGKNAGFASALLNLTKTLAPLKLAYLRGEITFAEFMNSGSSLALTVLTYSAGDAGMTAIVASVIELMAAGGLVLPSAGVIALGVAGSILGSIVIGKLIEVSRDFVNREVNAMISMHREFINDLTNTFNLKIEQLERDFNLSLSLVNTVGDLSLEVSERLAASNKLAEKYGTAPVDSNPDVDVLRKRFFKK